jgi:hypothetical protein
MTLVEFLKARLAGRPRAKPLPPWWQPDQPPQRNFECGITDRDGRAWIHVPWEGWQLVSISLRAGQSGATLRN